MTITSEALHAASCWEADDQIASRPAMTEFRRSARYHQAIWRESHHLPIGTQPIAPKHGDARVRWVGSRLPVDYALRTGGNFVAPAALAAVTARLARVEPHQSIDRQRLWADLLSSQALAFNLFGDLAADFDLADTAVHSWFPDTPGHVCDVLFAHSPGRLNPAYINSLRDFTCAFVLQLDDGTRGILSIDVKYHERTKAETPRPENLTRYIEVAQRSGKFTEGAIDVLAARGDLCVMWLEHVLQFSMLQHPSRAWSWCRYAVLYPRGNFDIADVTRRYRSMLIDDTTFATITLEQVLDSDALPASTSTALRDRYLF